MPADGVGYGIGEYHVNEEAEEAAAAAFARLPNNSSMFDHKQLRLRNKLRAAPAHRKTPLIFGGYKKSETLLQSPESCPCYRVSDATFYSMFTALISCVAKKMIKEMDTH